MVDWWLYAITVIPLSFIVGVGSIACAVSAWALLVPLLLDGFEMDVLRVLFISVSVDTVNSIMGMAFFAKNGHVNYFLSISMGIAAAILASFTYIGLGERFLDTYTTILKGGISILVFIIATAFLIKGILDWRREKKIKEGLIQIEEVYDNRYEDIYPPVLLFGRDSLQYKPELWKKALVYYLSWQLIFISELVAIFSGLVCAGTGTIFVLVFLIGFFFDVPRATGSALLVLSFMMPAIWVSMLADSPDIQHNFLDLLAPMFTAIVPSAFGVIVGAFTYKRIPKSKVILVVSAILYTVGITSTTIALVIRFTK